MSNKIVLGSGKLYIDTFNGTSLPDDSAIEVDGKLLGYIQGGATLTYTPTFYEAKDDLGYVYKKFLTEEEAVFKSGIMTWNADTLAKLCSTADTTSSTSSLKVLKVGGIGNYDGTQYVLHFVHEDSVDGDIRVTIVGSNEAGFELSFAKDKETVINAEFKAAPQDSRGTLIYYSEVIPFDLTPTSLSVVAGGSAGSVTLSHANDSTVTVTAPTGITGTVNAAKTSCSITAAGTVQAGTYEVSLANNGFTRKVLVTVTSE